MQNEKKILLALCFFIVASCGSNGSGTVNPEAAVTPEPIESVEEVSDPNELTRLLTEDLVSGDDFLFTSFESLTVSINLMDSVIPPDRITLCNSEKGGKSQSSECLYAGVFNGSVFNKDFVIQNNIASLELVLWFLGEEVRRDVFVWDRTRGNHWIIDL